MVHNEEVEVNNQVLAQIDSLHIPLQNDAINVILIVKYNIT